MKKISIILLLMAQSAFLFAQNDNQKAISEMSKDPSYIKFQEKLTEIMKTAKGKTSNIAEVKKLFGDNKLLLKNLSQKFKIGTSLPNSTVNKKPIKKHLNTGIREIQVPPTQVRIYTPPFQGTSELGYGQYSSSSDLDLDKGIISYTYNNSTGNNSMLGPKTYLFNQTIKIPSDPLLVAARVKFEYSILYTGWDTQLANFSTLLFVRASTNFRSRNFDTLPKIIYFSPTKEYRIADNLFTFTNFFSSDIKDFSFSKDTSITLKGFITPGSELYFFIGPGYNSHDRIGTYGCYHYAEFVLKKITATYLKANED